MDFILTFDAYELLHKIVDGRQWRISDLAGDGNIKEDPKKDPEEESD